MTVKRTLNRIRLDKIAAVDDPCQQHATVAIMKRRPDPAPTPASIAKATFAEALQANMTADAVNEAFYSSFDGLWERNDAFRCALTDELAAGGDGTVASEAYVASVKSLVDDAVAEARQAGASATDTSTIDKSLSAAAIKWLDSRKEHTIMKISNRAELTAAVSAFSIAKSTVADVEAIQKAAAELKAEDLLPADGPLAKAKADPELAKALREIAILKLAPEAKSHFDGLDEAGQTAFLGKSADEQKADIEKANATDPVIYKCTDGTEIRKSDGAAAARLAKVADDQAKELAKLRGDLTGSTLEKRAGETYPNVAKQVAVDMLKSAQQVGEDSDAGKALLSSLDTMNKSSSRLMRPIGSSEGGEGGSGGDLAKARTTFAQKVDEIAKRDNIGRADAMSKARVEHEELFVEAYPDTAAAAEEAAENASHSPA